MSEWKILLTDGLAKKGKEILDQQAKFDDRKGISAEELIEIAADYDAMIVRGRTKVNNDVFAAAKKLRVVGRCGVGADNIDLKKAKQCSVIVVNAPTATTLAVAEHTLALMLALAREVTRADAGMKSGTWLKKEIQGIELAGKTLGVVGYGRIGSMVGKLANAFRMRVLGHDRYLMDEEIKDRGGEPVSFDRLLEVADFISIHMPLTNETHNMLDADAFEKMKTGVRIVIAARGGIVDEEALLAALQSGKVAGAALDVFAKEPPGVTELLKHPKVIATPHIGGQTIEDQQRAAVDIATEVLAALKGNPLRWRVT
ncbi:MAG TPA: hydroxyacid dehydrogenase [Anaerolineae bacterium]|nr:hydroxyacid dehydrogenase [Anaerolineae bacterium]